MKSTNNEKYYRQKYHADRRGIPFDLTFEEWMDWWGDDLEKRGRGMGMLQMCRFNDVGSYTLGNIFKGTHEQNMKDKSVNGTHRSRPKSLGLEDLYVITSLLDDCVPTREIATMAGVSQRTVMRVKLKQGAYENT